MRILFINPNTTKEFTKRIQEIADKYRLPSTTVVAKNPDRGPRSTAMNHAGRWHWPP